MAHNTNARISHLIGLVQEAIKAFGITSATDAAYAEQVRGRIDAIKLIVDGLDLHTAGEGDGSVPLPEAIALWSIVQIAFYDRPNEPNRFTNYEAPAIKALAKFYNADIE